MRPALLHALMIASLAVGPRASAEPPDAAEVTSDFAETLAAAEKELADVQGEVEYGRRLIVLWRELQSNPGKLRDYLRFRAHPPSGYAVTDKETRALFQIAMGHDPTMKQRVATIFPLTVRVSVPGATSEALRTRFVDTLQIEARAQGLRILPDRGGTTSGWVLSQELMPRDIGTIMGTQMHSLRVGGAFRLLGRDGTLEDAFDNDATVGHIDAATGFTRAAQRSAENALLRLMSYLLRASTGG